MARISEDRPLSSIALTAAVLEAWDELVRRTRNGGLAEIRPPWNISDFSRRLAPIREHVCKALVAGLKDYPQFAAFRVSPSAFWGPDRRGAARLKEYIWNYLARDRAKTSGRLQLSFTPEHNVQSEYVAYKVTEQGRRFQIEKISAALQDPYRSKQIHEALKQLPKGFMLSCASGSGREIAAPASAVSDEIWSDLRQHGLDTNEYFVIGIPHDRDALTSLTITELAQLALEDFNDLTPVYGLLEGVANVPALPSRPGRAHVVAGARMRSVPAPRGTFRPEFIGKTTYRPPADDVVADRRHGVVVQELKARSVSLGMKFGNDFLRDGYWLNKDGSIRVLFEVKTRIARRDIYTAVGQLLLHGAAEQRTPKLVMLAPGMPNEETSRYLSKLGIQVMPYTMEGEAVSFEGLSDLAGSAENGL